MGVGLEEDASAGAAPNVNRGFNPRHQAALRTSVSITGGFEADVMLRYVGELPSPPVSDYLQADARLGWHVRPGITVALVGRDLFSARHPEFASVPQREIQRRAELQLEWRF
jgi:iron complex outermembrane receptor protein